MALHDDLLPGDEDAILDRLARDDLTSDGKNLMFDQIAAAAKMIREANPDVFDNLSSPFGGGGILNTGSLGQMPIFPKDDEYALPKDRFRWFANTQPVVVNPRSFARITSI